MRNYIRTKIKRILALAESLPYFTLDDLFPVGKNKTARFSNRFGRFFYHKIKDPLFCGFDIGKDGNFTILEATKVKALFDFLYIRKTFLVDEKAIEELRLNIENHL